MSDPAGVVERVVMRADPSELASLRRRVGRAVRAAGAPDDVAVDFELAVSELATNVIRHTEASDLLVTVLATDERWSLEVTRAEDLGDLHGLRLPSEAEHGGRGLLIVRSVMDEVDVVGEPGRRAVRCSRRRTP